MEQYKIIANKNNSITINQGRYYNIVHSKHIDSYGNQGASNIRENIMATFREAMRQLKDESKNNNMLLVGKVQSGKTSNLELFTALALDNGFNFVVIYGGYDNTLLAQTSNRFKKTFDIPSETDYSKDIPVIFSSDDSKKLLSVDNEIVEDLIMANKPIFIISMKRPNAMKKVNDLLKRIDKSDLKAFIIDDEGDQASLNTKKNKAEDASATYAQIVEIKNQLSNPLYLSVTATPQAIVFLDEYSALRPDSIRLIEPGIGYCGADSYHLYDSGIIEIISEEDQSELSSGGLSISLKTAIQHYIIASSIMNKRGMPYSDMIIHSHRNVSDHDVIYKCVYEYIQGFKEDIKYNDRTSLSVRYNEFLSVYDKLFVGEIHKKFDFDDLWSIICNKITRRIYIILKNSAGQITQANETLRKHKIYIGGDLLQRGVTFSNLVTTYFSRWANDGGNMDTNLQRARWFGYRAKYIDISKIFTTDNIAREFTNLSEIESDLWEQFYAIQSGDMKIDDILIRSDNTKQKPTRRNVASYKNVTFKNKWIKQRVGLFDKLQIASNNHVVDELIKNIDWIDTTVGRVDGSKSAKYAVLDRKVLSDLIDQMQMVFELEPFEKKPLKDLIDSSGDIPVILMSNFTKGRERSFYQDNRIYALHQGADNKNKDKALFKGDSFVVVDDSKVNIQIHNIVPKKRDNNGNTIVMDEFTQYMFAVYIPKEKKYFVKG